jgi:hypothetical protein
LISQFFMDGPCKTSIPPQGISPAHPPPFIIGQKYDES